MRSSPSSLNFPSAVVLGLAVASWSPLTAQAHGVVRDTAGQPRAFGPAYAATFDRGAFEFTPVCAGAAATDCALRFVLTGIERAGRAIALADQLGPADVQGDQVRWQRAQGVTERFDARANGVEISYRFERRPEGAGDLVVRARVDSSLRGEIGERLSSIPFTGVVAGACVTVGAVTGVDASGQSAAGHLNFDGHHLEMVLPGAFVDRATYPMVLDPLIGSIVQVSFGTPDDGAPDVACDHTWQRYLIVWERAVTPTDFDVIGQIVDASTGALIGGQIAIATGSGNQRHPAVASINPRDRFLVVWDDDSAGTLDIMCRGVVAGTGQVETALAVASSTPSDRLPDVGGESSDSGDSALVVWERVSGGILGAQVQISATGAISVASTANIATGSSSAQPAICKSGGESGRFFVTWVAGGTRIGGRFVDRNLGMLSAAAVLPVSNANVLRPGAAGDGTSFLAVYQQFESGSSGPSDVWAFNANPPASATAVWTNDRLAPLANVVGVDETAPTLSMPSDLFAVTWCERLPNNNVTARTANYSGGNWQRCGNIFDSGFNPTIGTAMASRRDGLARTGNHQAMIVHERRSGSPAGDIAAQRYVTWTGSSVSLGGGCGFGGQVYAEGFAFGNQRCTIDVLGADHGASFAVLNIGVPSSARFTCGQFTILNPLVLIPGTLIIPGEFSVPLPVPCGLELAGLVLDVQYVVFFTTGASPCFLVNNVAWSDVRRLTLTD